MLQLRKRFGLLSPHGAGTAIQAVQRLPRIDLSWAVDAQKIGTPTADIADSSVCTTAAMSAGRIWFWAQAQQKELAAHACFSVL